MTGRTHHGYVGVAERLQKGLDLRRDRPKRLRAALEERLRRVFVVGLPVGAVDVAIHTVVVQIVVVAEGGGAGGGGETSSSPPIIMVVVPLIFTDRINKNDGRCSGGKKKSATTQKKRGRREEQTRDMNLNFSSGNGTTQHRGEEKKETTILASLRADNPRGPEAYAGTFSARVVRHARACPSLPTCVFSCVRLSAHVYPPPRWCHY